MPGIQRRRCGRGFVYHDASGRRVRDAETLARIRRLAIPPAYTEVWICTDPCGHLQATGRDARGRKQYRYHDDWRALRDEGKFDRMTAFAAVLGRLRRQVDADLRRRGLSREVLLATLVRLLDTTHIRVGNVAYRRANNSYGLTTLRNRHARIRGHTVELAFRGKSGVRHSLRLTDPRVARIVRRCQELPGQTLFQYLDEEGAVHALGSADVNGYLRHHCRAPFTAKDFRTWHGSVYAFERLAPLRFSTKAEARRQLMGALREVAAHLGNTVAVCRKAYVHPALVDDFLAGRLAEEAARFARLRAAGGLTAAEHRLQAYLEARTAADPPRPQKAAAPSAASQRAVAHQGALR
ncbi:DNA topoisomerase IB [Gulbenkiania mobilis]|uniref:DNA topoisomerase IB n=1 Tax=Gulbenkiania mobilis TaxID=397457 RepID=UPI0009F9A1E5|nr:DNA topoisomerase IB [Gulbenkiania mobilis]